METKLEKKIVVLTAINFFEGGPLSILKDCINEINSNEYNNYIFIIFLHKKILLKELQLRENIKLIELPKSRKGYFYRLYYEYYYFKKYSKTLNVYLWFSLHDISPRVDARKRVVYCHNPTPFFSPKVKDLQYPMLLLSSYLYKFLYRINIKTNDFVVVQQEWIRNEFNKLFEISKRKIIVSHPNISKNIFNNEPIVKKGGSKFLFFYPCFPRSFKNIEILIKASELLIQEGIINFKIYLTLNGTENHYSKKIFSKCKNIEQIVFLGSLSRNDVYKYYSKVDALLFPSMLETWGLPISEFKETGKAILVSDLNFARETVGIYSKVRFINPYEASKWAKFMKKLILGQSEITFSETEFITYSDPFVIGWSGIFSKLLID